MRRPIGRGGDGSRPSIDGDGHGSRPPNDGNERARADGGSGGDPEVEATFERRLQGLVEWGVDNGMSFDRSWTIRLADRPGDDVMVEFVYLEDDGE